ncbi:hypothetical protein [Streptomyces sp. NPDC017993]|uniref:hypothetical protein n=1 Tax=Streptomyces sp. NPDC017993 TaxID=3365027 RepID=UPI003791E8CA
MSWADLDGPRRANVHACRVGHRLFTEEDVDRVVEDALGDASVQQVQRDRRRVLGPRKQGACTLGPVAGEHLVVARVGPVQHRGRIFLYAFDGGHVEESFGDHAAASHDHLGRGVRGGIGSETRECVLRHGRSVLAKGLGPTGGARRPTL